ncbi:MAG TPA: hypothetical protein VKS79_09605 [Gemmataceae bacterium]|nr:hypothetical protein [Gemmataceae bacterium]
MLRASFCSLAVLFVFTLGAVRADDTKNSKDKKETKATITKVDPKAGTITVKMKDKEGKETERTFKLESEVQMFDDNGKAIRAADISVFRSGEYVLFVEREGKIPEIHKDRNGNKDQKKPGDR